MRVALRTEPDLEPELQIAPLIDVLLVLLVFFTAISSTEVLQSVKDIQLPVAKAGREKDKSPGQVIVNILWEPIKEKGSLIINEADYPLPEDIVPVLSDSLKRNADVRVLVRADKMAHYEYVRSVMVAVSAAQIPNITFSVVDKELPSQHAMPDQL